jgi:hypothetical protein
MKSDTLALEASAQAVGWLGIMSMPLPVPVSLTVAALLALWIWGRGADREQRKGWREISGVVSAFERWSKNNAAVKTGRSVYSAAQAVGQAPSVRFRHDPRGLGHVPF